MIIYVASLYIDCEKSLWINFDQLSYFACALSPCFQSHPALQPMPMLLQQRLLHLTPTLALCRPAWCPLTSCPVPPYWSPATPAFPYPLLLLPPPLHRNSWGQTDWRWGGTQTFTHIRKKKWGKNIWKHIGRICIIFVIPLPLADYKKRLGEIPFSHLSNRSFSDVGSVYSILTVLFVCLCIYTIFVTLTTCHYQDRVISQT